MRHMHVIVSIVKKREDQRRDDSWRTRFAGSAASSEAGGEPRPGWSDTFR